MVPAINRSTHCCQGFGTCQGACLGLRGRKRTGRIKATTEKKAAKNTEPIVSGGGAQPGARNPRKVGRAERTNQMTVGRLIS